MLNDILVASIIRKPSLKSHQQRSSTLLYVSLSLKFISMQEEDGSPQQLKFLIFRFEDMV